MNIKCFVNVSLVGLLVVFMSATVRADGSRLRARAQQVGSEILPYEALRLRLTLANVDSDSTGPLPWLHDSIVVSGVKAPGSNDYYTIRANVIQVRETSAPSSSAHLSEKQPMVLKPGDELSVTFALSAEWGRKPKPLFPVPGEYHIKVGYSGPREIGDVFAEPVAVTVRQPQGPGVMVYQQLAQRPRLAAALMSPIRPPSGEVLPAVRDIVERFPRTIYANYARFALARAALNGVSLSARLPEIARATALTQLERIAATDFGYGPNVLVLLRRLQLNVSQKAQIRAELDRDFGDSIVWLADRLSAPPPRESKKNVGTRGHTPPR